MPVVVETEVSEAVLDAPHPLLARLGIELVVVPEGEFLMGTNAGESEEDGLAATGGQQGGEFTGGAFSPQQGGASLRGREHPQHTVGLDAYYCGRCPVTVEQYAFFAKATRHAASPHIPAHRSPDATRSPVSFVTWVDANSFCRWLSSETGAPFRLPTEAEWEKAARGADGRTYPWGDDRPTAWRCNHASEVGAPTDVRSYPGGASPYGCIDMAGNVWEWCADWFDPDCYRRSPDRNPTGPTQGISRVIRGGAYDSEASALRCAARFYDDPNGPTFYPCGFRIVMAA